jgi:hypothetical protein
MFYCRIVVLVSEEVGEMTEEKRRNLAILEKILGYKPKERKKTQIV